MTATAILGRTCSGKTIIVDKIISTYGYKKVITYTSRPMRKGEIQDKDYHFVSKEEFEKKIEDGFFAEWKSYDTEFGIWYYGTSIDSLKNADDKSLIIITPDGYRDIKSIGIQLNTIYIYANNKTIKDRLRKRGDSKEEANRRFNADCIDFKGLENEVDVIIYNNDDSNLDNTVDKVFRYLECWRANE